MQPAVKERGYSFLLANFAMYGRVTYKSPVAEKLFIEVMVEEVSRNAS
jgi:hypothetical protein